jgi:hypothetical protein
MEAFYYLPLWKDPPTYYLPLWKDPPLTTSRSGSRTVVRFYKIQSCNGLGGGVSNQRRLIEESQ